MKLKKEQLKKIALALSVCLLILWGILGTGASIAWFTDTSSEVKNIFHVAEFDLVVSHRLDDGTYKEIDAKTQVFDDKALYEPGYVQVVYLKVENRGTVPFDYKTAVSVTDYTIATNVFGRTFNLQDYLKFGLVVADTEEELEQKLANRELAKENAAMPLNNYSTETASLEAKDEIYMALIVRMPEEVGNVANYRGTDIPRVELGLIVSAEQQGKQ
ncbi:MAG: hypothetical protein IJZ53_00730 [Tyzzerella sp.]|nr:hypothetical protein [Tyzzerella sp.]